MRKLLYNVNGIAFPTMKMANKVAKAANAKPKPFLEPIIEHAKRTPEEYKKIQEYFNKRGE